MSQVYIRDVPLEKTGTGIRTTYPAVEAASWRWPRSASPGMWWLRPWRRLPQAGASWSALPSSWCAGYGPLAAGTCSPPEKTSGVLQRGTEEFIGAQGTVHSRTNPAPTRGRTGMEYSHYGWAWHFGIAVRVHVWYPIDPGLRPGGVTALHRSYSVETDPTLVWSSFRMLVWRTELCQEQTSPNPLLLRDVLVPNTWAHMGFSLLASTPDSYV